jgi:hypothetical protein
MSIPAHRACINSITHHRLRRIGRHISTRPESIVEVYVSGKQKTDIRARRQRSTVPVDEMRPPRQAAVRVHRHRRTTGIDRKTLSQCPLITSAAPPVTNPNTVRTEATPRRFPTPRRSEAPPPSYREHGRTFPASAPTPVLDRIPDSVIILRKVRPPELLGIDHCSS